MEEVKIFETLAKEFIGLYESLAKVGPAGISIILVIAAILFLVLSHVIANLSSISALELIFKEKKFELYRQISIDLILCFMFFVVNIIFVSDPTIIVLCTGLIVLGWGLYFLAIIASRVLQRIVQDKWIKPILNKVKHNNFHYIVTAILLSPVAIIVLQSSFDLNNSGLEKKVLIYCLVVVFETLFIHLCMTSTDIGESSIQLISNNETLYYLCKPNNEIILCGDNKTVDTSDKIVPIAVENLKEGDFVLKKIPYEETNVNNDISSYSNRIIADATIIDSFIKRNSFCDVDLTIFDGNKSLLKYVYDGNMIYMYLEKNDQLRGTGHQEQLTFSIPCIWKKQYLSGKGVATLYYRNTREYDNLIASTAILKKHENEIRNSNHIISFELDKDDVKLENYYSQTTYVYYDAADDPETVLPE